MAKLGFDIGGSSLKIAVVREREVRLEEMRLPENMVDEGGVILPHVFAGFLKQAKKELALPRGDAALALPPSQAICRLVTMPRMTTEQLLLNLPYEFSDFIQGEADQYFCDYAVCASTEEDEGEGIPMMAAVAAKSRHELVGKFSHSSHNKGDEKTVGVDGCHGYTTLIILNATLL